MMSTSRNRLLVSVRNLAEAQSALAGGCTILDFKEPAAGSLGKAAPETLHTACTALRETVPGLTLSAALGEALEASARALHPLPHGLDFVKLGCAGLTRFGSKWSHRWLAARKIWQTQLGPETAWITVIYADWERAVAPNPQDLLVLAREAGSRGVLLDTYEKDGLGLLHWMAPAQLQEVVGQCHEHGLLVAVAGSLQRSDLPVIREFQADLIAIRGAACGDGGRTGTIDTQAVAEWVTALR